MVVLCLFYFLLAQLCFLPSFLNCQPPSRFPLPVPSPEISLTLMSPSTPVITSPASISRLDVALKSQIYLPPDIYQEPSCGGHLKPHPSQAEPCFLLPPLVSSPASFSVAALVPGPSLTLTWARTLESAHLPSFSSHPSPVSFSSTSPRAPLPPHSSPFPLLCLGFLSLYISCSPP